MKQYEFHVSGILNECEDITVTVFASTEEEAMDKAVDLVKQYNEDDVFDIETVDLIPGVSNINS